MRLPEAGAVAVDQVVPKRGAGVGRRAKSLREAIRKLDAAGREVEVDREGGRGLYLAAPKHILMRLLPPGPCCSLHARCGMVLRKT